MRDWGKWVNFKFMISDNVDKKYKMSCSLCIENIYKLCISITIAKKYGLMFSTLTYLWKFKKLINNGLHSKNNLETLKMILHQLFLVSMKFLKAYKMRSMSVLILGSLDILNNILLLLWLKEKQILT